MLIFCCLIKSNRRSSGPSYIGIFILYGVAILSFILCRPTQPPSFRAKRKISLRFFFCSCHSSLAARHFLPAANLSPFLLPPENRFPHSFHRAFLPCPRLLHPCML